MLSITSVLPVALSIRHMYYRHKAAGGLDHKSVGWALASAEKYFILISSLLFCVVFVPISGILSQPSHDLREKVRQGVAFWGFFTFNTAIYSYIGVFPIDLCNVIYLLLSNKPDLSHHLFRATLHVLCQRRRYSSNLGQRFHWNQQLLFWFDCPSTTDE